MSSHEFARYWSELRSDVDEIETEWERSSISHVVESRGKRWTIDRIRYSSLGDQVIEGWISVPYDHPINGAGFLWLPGYSYGTPPPDDSNLVTGTVTLAINVHGNSWNAPYINPAGKNDYILEGIQSPETFIYRAIVGHCLTAVSVLANQPETQMGIGVGGMSQGGGLALIVAAQNKTPKFCCADMPFLSNIQIPLSVSQGPIYRTLRGQIEKSPDALSTVLLFDTLFHAECVNVPTWMSAGGKDPSCPHKAVESVFSGVKAESKQYVFFPNAGHVLLPEMNAAYEAMIQRVILA